MALTSAAAPGVESRRAETRRLAVFAAAGLLAAVAVIHASVVPAHLREWLPAGLFFIVLAAGQAGLAVALVRRPDALTLLAAIWSTIGVVGVYVWSRTSGLPFVPVDHGGGHDLQHDQAGHAVGGHGNGVPIFPGTPKPSTAESVGGPDLVVLAAELAAIVVLVYLLPPRPRRWTGNGLLACGLALVALRITGVLA